MAVTTASATPSTTGPVSAPSAIPGPNTTTRPCDRSVTATAAPCAASPIASSPCSLPCSVTKPSTTQPGLSPPNPSPHDTNHHFTNGGESDVTEGGALRRGRRASARRREPTASEAGAAKARNEIGAAAHEAPEEAGAIVLDHQDDRPVIQPEVTRRDPAAGLSGIGREGRIECRLEAVRARFAQAQLIDVPDRWKHDLRCEWERSDDRPRSERSVVGSSRDRPGDVVEETPFDAVD